jgi:hypothetical protein
VVDDFEAICLMEPCLAAIIKEREAENKKKSSAQIKEKKNIYAQFDHVLDPAPPRSL